MPGTRPPRRRSAAGRCSRSPGKGLLAHRERGGTLHTYAMLARPRDWFAHLDFTDAAAAAGRIADEFDGWAPELTALIADGDTAPVLRPLHALPVEHRWARVPGMTLLGDAAHLSLPNGEGANLAMYDGAELGKALAAHPGRSATGGGGISCPTARPIRQLVRVSCAAKTGNSRSASPGVTQAVSRTGTSAPDLPGTRLLAWA